MVIVTLLTWVLCGLVTYGWWGQLVCFAAATYLMIELSNNNSLLRVRSRMVSACFLALSCATCFLFYSLSAGIVQLCLVAATIILFHTYQDSQSPGWTFYSFLCLGLASLVFVQVLYLVPVVWLLMITQLQSMSWRSWIASLLGLATPYWFLAAYFLYQQDLTFVAGHFARLVEVPFPFDYATLGVSQISSFFFTLLFSLIGVFHLWVRGFEDKIRTRQLYGYFTGMSFVLALFLILQPQHFDVLMRMLIVTTSPLIAHVLTLTHTKASNILFIVGAVLALLLTLFHLLFPYLSAWIG